MAFAKTVNTPQGFVAENAYHKVDSVQIENKNIINFVIKASKDKNAIPFSLKGHSCKYDIEGKNPIAQAYEYVKRLTEYAGFVDC